MESVLQQIPLSARHEMHRFQGYRRTSEARPENSVLQGNAVQSVVMVDDSTIEVRLINWGRWCKMGRTHGTGHCGSIEWQWVGRWKEKYGWQDSGDSEKILDRVNVLDAEEVQSIMVHLPITFRHVLSLKYVHRESPKRIAYKAGCREWALDALIAEARNAAKICLTGIKKNG